MGRFDNYFDADMAAEIWEAAPRAPAQTLTSPRFEAGSIVRVFFFADTTPVVHPMHAEGILVANVIDLLMKAITTSLQSEEKDAAECRGP